VTEDREALSLHIRFAFLTKAQPASQAMSIKLTDRDKDCSVTIRHREKAEFADGRPPSRLGLWASQ